MKKKIIIILSIVVILIALVIGIYAFSLTATKKTDETTITFVVNTGDSKSDIVDNLVDANLVRSKYATLVYIVLSGKTNFQAGTYEFNRSMSTQDIVRALDNGDTLEQKRETVSITFNEGITLREYLELISDNTSLEYDTIIEEINDSEFLNELIENYWFLTDDILNSDIYYDLEGYLFPETYEFYVDTTLGEVINKILSVTDTKLSALKTEIEESTYSIHEIMTMASITEKEAVTYSDRTSVAQVIYKRLEMGMSLGMDVTSYYGVGKDMTETLTYADLNDENAYNTRLTSFIGLPVGPICNPSLEAVEAVLNPSDTEYIYFYADIITGNVYFTDDYNEFLEFQQLYG